jgi:hypothetical protein
MSQNISAKESWFQAFLQTEEKSDVRLWDHDILKRHTLSRFAWCKVVPGIGAPDTPESNIISTLGN